MEQIKTGDGSSSNDLFQKKKKGFNLVLAAVIIAVITIGFLILTSTS